jgi:shikimate kinase
MGLLCRGLVHYGLMKPNRKPSSLDNLVLIGPMGSGKSAVAKALAALLGFKSLDSDDLIIKKTGVDIAYIFEKEGEVKFRDREAEVIRDLLSERKKVIATGGGVVLREENRRHIRQLGFVVYLRTSVDEQVKRTSTNQNRPLLKDVDPHQKLSSLMTVRAPLYEELADFIVDTDHSRVKSVAILIQKAFVEAQSKCGQAEITVS